MATTDNTNIGNLIEERRLRVPENRVTELMCTFMLQRTHVDILCVPVRNTISKRVTTELMQFRSVIVVH